MSAKITSIAEILLFLQNNNRSKAAENLLILYQARYFRVDGSKTVSDAIDSGMSWGGTPEGHEYWSRTKRLIKHMEKKKV